MLDIILACCDWRYLGVLELYVPPRKRPRVSPCEATHCSNANALHTLFDAAAVSCDGLSSG